MRSQSRGLVVGAVCLLSIGLLLGVSFSSAAGKGKSHKSMLLEIDFKVAKERASDFEKMYTGAYAPALQKQEGYLRSNLLRVFPENVARGIKAAPTEFNYQMQLVFDTEENRQKWVASKEHIAVWPLASGMAKKVAWRGFDVVAKDRKSK